MTKVPKDELIKALEYLEIPIPESLEKGMESKELEGSEQNGGDSGLNDLNKKKSDIQAKIAKSKQEQEELEGELKKCGSTETMKKSKDEEEEVEKEKPEMEPEKDEEKEGMKKSIQSLTTLVKSQMEKTDSLEKSLKEQREILDTPIERRSAAGISEMRKSLGFDGIEEKGSEGAGSGSTTKISILEKGRLSNVLMGIMSENATPDQGLENAIMTYEASGFLDQSTIDLVKSKGIEIIK
jgi:hypothetical protein